MTLTLATAARMLPLILLLSSSALVAGVSEEIVSFTTHDDLQIQCVLSYPDRGSGPYPGMLLIPGSGLHDADVTLDVSTLSITQGPQSLFKPLAQYFSRRGWAVQRCNKRGASFGHLADRPHVLDNATLDDLVEDARSALATLHQHSRVVASPLVVLGHSEGALIATRLAAHSREIDLLVLMGSVDRRFDSLIEYQLVDRNLAFLRQAADANGDGSLTLEELDLLDAYGGKQRQGVDPFGCLSDHLQSHAAAHAETHEMHRVDVELGHQIQGIGRMGADGIVRYILLRVAESRQIRRCGSKAFTQ